MGSNQKGQVAVVVGVGAKQGLGATLARRFAREGLHTFVALRSVAQGMAREFGPRGLHVGHVIIDGVIDGDQVNGRFPQLKEARGEQGMLNIDAIADAFWMLHAQHPSAWTQELDLRPFKEEF